MKKIIPLFLFSFMFVFFAFSSNVSAVEIDGREYPYFVEYRSHPTTVNRVYSTEPILMNSTIMKYKGWVLSYYKINEGSWVKNGDPIFYSAFANTSGAITDNIFASSHDIINPDTGTVFFSGPPPKYQVTVAEMGQVSLGDLMTDFGQTLGTLLPVGLILSSMVLVLYLVRRFLLLFGLSNK